ncbi:PA-domain containing subtilase family protein [Artemisia annua]|uniref:PA-domain containing subtilase family protein n=1 Tax=Artemisia annua TaxID=35608 RepID=A0A2U1PV36_ARTAN|nr:PA-domain containing subtilase family protein [Artemisia annua]
MLKAHAKHLEESHDQLLQSTLEEGAYNKLYSFNHIVNGFSVHTTPSQAKKLKNTPGVKLIEKDNGVQMMTTYTPKFLELPRGVWPTVGGRRHAGEGIVIGFVDSGINPSHPSFAYHPRRGYPKNLTRFNGVCDEGPMFPRSSCNGKIVTARYFSAGVKASGLLNASVDILSPYDAVGHGSHVAATAAGNYGVPVVVNGFYYGRASGMAPRARIAVYKAIYPSVGTKTDVLAAIEQAIKDRVDILTLSIGPDTPPKNTLTMLSMFDIFMLFARKAGVLVIQAAGNRGPGPYTTASYSPWAVGVASCDTDRTYSGSLVLGHGQRIRGIGLSGPTFGNTLLRYKLVLAKDAILPNGNFPRTPDYIEECQHPEAFDPIIVQQSVVICMFSSGFLNGTSNPTAISNTARTLRFMGFVFIANPMYGDFLTEPLPFSIPGIMIPKTRDSKIILDYYEKQTERDSNGVVTAFRGRAAIGEGRFGNYNVKAPIVSRFSSRGPNFMDSKRNPTDLLKPDILAPGRQIWAAWSPMSVKLPILSGQSFGLMSGTSMAAPHVAGVAALIKQRNPTWSPSMIASAMATTAFTYDNRGEPIMAHSQDIYTLNRSTPFDHGAGLVNPTRAIDPGLVFISGFEDYMSFLCSLPNTDPEIIKTAIGEECAHSFHAPSDLNIPSLTISALNGKQLVRRTVKSVADTAETYVCAVVPPKGVAVELNPPWFTIAPEGTQDLEVILKVTQVQDSFSYGEIVLTGNMKHMVRIPLSVLPASISEI